MKIATIEAMVLKAPVPGIGTWKAASFAVPFKFAETTLVRIETDDGTEVRVEISEAQPGFHGLHLHASRHQQACRVGVAPAVLVDAVHEHDRRKGRARLGCPAPHEQTHAVGRGDLAGVVEHREDRWGGAT